LHRGPADVSRHVVDALGAIGDEQGALAIGDALEDSSLRLNALISLDHLGPAAEPAVAKLIGVLKDPDAHFRKSAAETLGRIGPGARSAALLLSEMLRENDRNVR